MGSSHSFWPRQHNMTTTATATTATAATIVAAVDVVAVLQFVELQQIELTAKLIHSACQFN